jgi:hypothetical protein
MNRGQVYNVLHPGSGQVLVQAWIFVREVKEGKATLAIMIDAPWKGVTTDLVVCNALPLQLANVVGWGELSIAQDDLDAESVTPEKWKKEVKGAFNFL